MNPIRKENPKRMASKLGHAIDAVDLGIRRYLLHRHLAHWHPISTAPHNQDLEIRALDEDLLVAIPFPCKRTNASDWTNADLGTRVYMRSVRWRIWRPNSATDRVDCPPSVARSQRFDPQRTRSLLSLGEKPPRCAQTASQACYEEIRSPALPVVARMPRETMWPLRCRRTK